MLARYYFRQFVKEFFKNAHENAKATGFMDFLRHLKTPPEFRLEPLMPSEIPKPRGTVLPAGATAERREPFTVGVPMRENPRV